MINAENLKDRLYEYVIDGDHAEAANLTQQGLDMGLAGEDLLYDALIPALEEVGRLFEQGEFFVPEMLVGAKAMKAGLNLLRPILAQSGAKPVGTFLLLTVKGDIHDIGKDLVRVMLEGAGFQVIDLGVNVEPEEMIAAIREHQPQIVGFSAFLTTTIPMFKKNIELLEEAGLRDQVKIMVGGAPVSEAYARHVGADGYAAEASTATRIALDFIRNPETSSYLLRPEVGQETQSFKRIAGSGVPLAKPKRKLPTNPEMKPVERVLSVLRLEEPDRVPHFEWEINAEVIEALSGSRDYFDFIELMDIDAVMVSPHYRTKMIGADLLVDEWGATRRQGKDDTALPVDEMAPIKTWADLEAWQPPDPDDPYRYEGVQAALDRFGGERAIFLQIRDVWSGPRDYLGYAQLFINLKENPELVVGIAKKCVDHYVRIVERAAEMGIHVVMSGDDVADNRGPMFAPTLWETLFVPQYRRLMEAIHGAGLSHWKHSDGNMYPLLDSIVAAGSDGIDPIDPLGGMELSVVKAKYGRSVAIKGNVDQIELLEFGPPEKVVEAVKRCIREAGIGGGYVCSSSNSIHSGVDPQLYKVMVEAIHHYGRYPLDMDMLAARESRQ